MTTSREELMTEQKDGQGSYTSIPNVFFDTCDLPETAQILYLRLYREVHFKDCKFVGSIRKLSQLVRLSKSTVDRMIKKLQDAGLISIEYQPGDEANRDVMIITLHKEKLWNLNRHQDHGEAVPIWDKVMPERPTLGQDVPKTGQQRPKLGHFVPGSSSKSGQTIINNSNNSKKHGSFSNQSQEKTSHASTLTSQEKQNAAMKKLLEAVGMTEDIDQVQ
jgi:DNA-binding MarR family transcriptional regulator